MTFSRREINCFIYIRSHLKYVYCIRHKCSETQKPMRFYSESQDSSNPNSFLKVLTNGAHGLSKSIAIKTHSTSVLFNCGEAVDRAFKGSVQAVFVTYLDWTRIGGIPSLCHKFSNRNIGELTMYGPDGLDVFIYGAERFLPVNGFKIDIRQNDCHSPIILDNLEVVCVPITNRKMKHIQPSPIDKGWIVRPLQPYQRNGSILKRPANKKVALDTSYSYICKSQTPKAWILSECVKKGVKPGPGMLKLWNGEDLSLDDGRLIRPSDVIRVETHCAVIIVDCPTEGYLEDLLEKKEYDKYFKSESSSSVILVHFTPISVMKDQRYINWMERFPQESTHLIVNDSNESNGREKVINRHEVCKLISPRFFPDLCQSVVLRSQDNPLKSNQSNVVDESEKNSNDYFIKDVTTSSWLQNWRDLPKKLHLAQAWCGTTVNLKNQEIFRVSEPYENSNIQNLLEGSSPSKDSVTTDHAAAAPAYPLVTFLGTCSQGSSTYRNASGILVQSSHNKALLLDCGDGIVHQLSTMYSSSQMNDMLTSLKCIYLSHPHADHHAGVIGILTAINKAKKLSRKRTQKVVLLAPAPLIEWLEIYHNRFEPVLEDVIVVVISDMIGSPLQDKHKISTLFRKMLDLKKIKVCRATHCPFSYCLSLEHIAGWKISYSGDTVISDTFIRIGHNSDLLIHEATYASDLRDRAHAHAHSTTAEAIEVGRRMNAKHIILTHFSKRYPVIPYLKDLENTSNVSIAFDFLQVALSDLHLLPRLNDSYKIVFEEYEKENELETFRLRSTKSLSEELDEANESTQCNTKKYQ